MSHCVMLCTTSELLLTDLILPLTPPSVWLREPLLPPVYSAARHELWHKLHLSGPQEQIGVGESGIVEYLYAEAEDIMTCGLQY